MELKYTLICTPVLAFLTAEGHSFLDTADASDFGIGGVLGQLQDGTEHVVAYCNFFQTVPALLLCHQVWDVWWSGHAC